MTKKLEDFEATMDLTQKRPPWLHCLEKTIIDHPAQSLWTVQSLTMESGRENSFRKS